MSVPLRSLAGVFDLPVTRKIVVWFFFSFPPIMTRIPQQVASVKGISCSEVQTVFVRPIVGT